MMHRAAIVFAVLGLVRGFTTPFPFQFPGELEWDCTDDHAPHPTDQRKFLQSPNGFGPTANVITSQCPTRWMVFSQEDGLCRCLYIAEVRTRLDEPCQSRSLNDAEPGQYEVLTPSLDTDTIEELYVPHTCLSLLPANVINFFKSENVDPLFFNDSSCRCEWTEQSKTVKSRPVPKGRRCETLVEQEFSSPEVVSDVVGNWIDIIPPKYQHNMTMRAGGSEFGNGVVAALNWRLVSFDFRLLHLITMFKAESGNNNQLIFSNVCNNKTDSGGFVELQYNPGSRKYFLQFFGQNVAECTPPSSGAAASHSAQVIYNRGVIRLVVDDFECDVGVLNPVLEGSKTRIQFSAECPFQLGGAVYTNNGDRDFGEVNDRVEGFKGVYQGFVALRNCQKLPKRVQTKIDRLRNE